MLLTYSMISAVWGEGRGLVQRAIYCWALISLLPPSPFISLPLGAMQYLIQVKSTGQVSMTFVVCLRFGDNQTVFDGTIPLVHAVSNMNRAVAGSAI